MKSSSVRIAAMVFGLLFGGGSAVAAVCSPNGPSPGGSTDNVLINSIGATSCSYYEPNSNDSETLLNTTPAGGFAGISSWDWQWTTSDGGADKGAIGDLQLSFSSLNLTAGTVNLNWTGGPATADLAFIVKASNEFYAYFFDDFVFTPASGTYGSSYTVQIFNSQGGTQGLSHLSIYSTNVAPCTDGDCGGGGGGGSVPEPAPIALMGLAFAGMAMLRRRNKAAKAA